MFNSIRSRLALSFAAIALLAALALGAVLLVTLQSYYAQREVAYLEANAFMIGTELMKMMSGSVPTDEVQSQIDNLAFLSQARVRVYNTNKQLMFDSGVPQNVEVSLGVLKQNLPQPQPTNGKPPGDVIGVISPIDKARLAALPTTVKTNPIPASTPDARSGIVYRSMYIAGSPFGIGLSADADLGGARSTQSVMQPIVSTENGAVLGLVELSDGPAYGHAILSSVAWGWALASAVAVLLAAGVGGLISRRISAPVLALTAVTTRMAHGALSSRAEIKSSDEFGQLARAFNEMAQQVETTVATLRRFVSDAAHELQTPVTALRTNLELLRTENDSEARDHFIASAQALVARLEELNRNLLDLSRLEASEPMLSEPSCDLSALLRHCAETYASQAEQARLSLELQAPALPVWIAADLVQVRRALDNLFDNACKFTPPGGTVRVRLAVEGAQVVLAVSDTGIGIPPEDLTQLFNRFHRGQNARSYEGSGLGLAIVKAIVTQQGGRVTAENLSPGALFALSWPAVATLSAGLSRNVTLPRI